MLSLFGKASHYFIRGKFIIGFGMEFGARGLEHIYQIITLYSGTDTMWGNGSTDPTCLHLFITLYVHVVSPLCFSSHFLRKVVSVINVSILCANIIKLSSVCICIKFDFLYRGDA